MRRRRGKWLPTALRMSKLTVWLPAGGNRVLPWQGPHLRSLAEGTTALHATRSFRADQAPEDAQVCPFANLPELTAGRWAQGFTVEKTKEGVWLRPEVEFLEWADADRLRDTKFAAFREDNDPSTVFRKT
jgi:hypothetical protein